MKKDSANSIELQWRRLRPKLLYVFLRKHNLLLTYFKNCDLGDGRLQKVMSAYNIIKVLNIFPYDDIASAFSWVDTQEGCNFWADINFKYNNFIFEKRKQFDAEHDVKYI
jgi:hypothetical protein